MVNKARMIENIADLVKEKRIDGISDLNDESNREGMRVVVELKREANPQVVLTNCTALLNCRTPLALSCWRWTRACPR